MHEKGTGVSHHEKEALSNEENAHATDPRSPKLAILVAGVHRSGTSAVTRLLSLLGCDLPKTLLLPNASNEMGYWESQPVLTLNDEILAAFGSAWDDWQPFRHGRARSCTLNQFRERAQAVLADGFGASRRFVLKDPRLCRLLPFWIKAVQAVGATPLVVCPIRNPLEVAASLEKRDGIALSVGHLLWLCDVLEAEVASRPVTRVYVRYEDLLRDWRAVVNRLAEGFGRSWPGISPAAEQAIDGFLTPSARHHAATDTQVLEDATLSPWLRSSFGILNRWTRGERWDTDTVELDRIREAFRHAAPTFAAPIVAGQQAVHRARALEAKLREQETWLSSEQARATELQHRLSAREHAIRQLTHSFSWRLTRPLRVVHEGCFNSLTRITPVINRLGRIVGRFMSRSAHPRLSGRRHAPSKEGSPTDDVNQLKLKLFDLGFRRRTLTDLRHLAADPSNPQRQRQAAWELAVWHAHQPNQSDTEQCLKYLSTVTSGERDPARLQRATILAADCYDALGRPETGRPIVQEALAQWQTADLFLAAANLEPMIDARIRFINKALELTGVSPIACETTAGQVPFACIRPAETRRGSSTRRSDSPKVSVIMSAYNAADSISTAIDSILAQTWDNLELLVVDDCSTDSTTDIVKAYQARDSRLHLLNLETNQGMFVARNIGLTRAIGHFVTCHDADDWSHPEKIERQVRDLVDHAFLIGNMSRDVRMTPALNAYSQGKRGRYVIINFSSLMFHRSRVVSTLGFWDSLRFSADGEFLWRIKKMFGKDSVKELPEVLSFAGISDHSLTAHAFFGFPWFNRGVCREYREAFFHYHNQADTLYLPFPQHARPFSVPEVMKPGRRTDAASVRHFDIILASDFRLPGGITSSNVEEIRANQRLGLKTGLVQVSRYDVDSTRPVHSRIRRLLDEGAAQMLVYGERISCDLLIIRHPPVLQDWQQYLPTLMPIAARVVVDQAPFRHYSRQGQREYEIRDCARHLQEMFHTDGVWCPASPLGRAVLSEHHAEELSAVTLDPEDWRNLIEVGEWQRPARPAGHSSIRIGRHSRDAVEKWPADRDTLLAWYPVEPGVEVRILGGATRPRQILGELPTNWHIWEFGAREPREFLEALDVYVYFSHHDSVEAYPRAILEAMAVGVPVILPPHLQPLFQDAALYPSSDGVLRAVKRLMAEPDLYESQVRAGTVFLEKHHSYFCHRERLERVLGRPLTFDRPCDDPGHVEDP